LIKIPPNKPSLEPKEILIERILITWGSLTKYHTLDSLIPQNILPHSFTRLEVPNEGVGRARKMILLWQFQVLVAQDAPGW
jgi:hypothetical protein